MIPQLKQLDYQERLEKLKLFSLKYRRLRGDLIEMYKLTHNCYNKIQLPLPFNHANTRGHCFKLLVNRNTKDPRRNFFTERICQDWNKLPNNITEAESLTIFKHRLDVHLSKKHFEIDWIVCAPLATAFPKKVPSYNLYNGTITSRVLGLCPSPDDDDDDDDDDTLQTRPEWNRNFQCKRSRIQG